jgi:hypothetical protein
MGAGTGTQRILRRQGFWRTRSRQDAKALEKPGFGNSEIGKQGAEFLTANHANGKAGEMLIRCSFFPSAAILAQMGEKEELTVTLFFT